MAIFDIVTTPSRSNPLALLQPRPRLEHLLPDHSSKSSRTPHNLPETTYVGLVGDSLYAMGHTNFPLVVFDQEPPRMAIPEGDVSVSYQCLVGSRKFEPNSQWYPPPLLDAVPNIPGLLEAQVPLDRIIQSESPSSDGETNESRLIADIGEEGRQTYEEAQLGKWGIIGLAAMLFVALAKYFMGNRQVSSSIQPAIKEIAVDGEKLMTDSIPIPTSSAPINESIAIATEIQPDSDPMQSIPPTDGPTSHSQPPSDEYVGEPEDGDESEKEGPSDIPRRKGPRRRKRGKKKKAEGVVTAAEQAEDDVVVKDALDEPPIPSLTPITPLPVPSSPSSLLVSDSVLGEGHFYHTKANTNS